MFSCRFCLFSMVTVLCFGSSAAKKCAEADQRTLLKLKDGLTNGSDSLSLWNGEDCCKWQGISCNNLTGHEIRLDLPTTDYFGPLQGNLDSSICELQHLTYLDLSGNLLKGEIPKCIGSLGQLIELELANNQLFGSLPHTVVNLTSLQNLDLGHNNLVSNELEWLSHLSNLRYLALSKMDLSRAIDWPSSISKLPYLVELYLDGCWLPPVDPKYFASVNSSTSLHILNLRSNNLNSLILSWVLNVTKVLTSLDLSTNSLSSVPDGFVNMSTLQHLDLSNNQLGGSVIEFFEALCQGKDLESLVLYNNPFSSGPFPDFSMLSSLKTLSLRYTNIVGPLSFDHLPHLEYLDLSFNYLNGSLPMFDVTKFSSLKYLDLSHNELSGTVPHTIGQLSNLTTLSLSSNKLNGILPYAIWQLSNLTTLSVTSNELNGNISEVHLQHLPRLELLAVSGNSLHFNLSPNWIPPFQLSQLYASSCILGPQFPTWLKHQRELQVLQISNTSIIDSIPEWFWKISSSLTYLNASQNKLSGALSKSLSSIKANYWSVWDFSSNNLSGPLPPFPEQYSLKALFLSNNMLSGSVSFFCPKLPMCLTCLDLSRNVLVGPIPNCWEKFPSLRILNLANNSLSGRIPKSFGTLQKIELMHLNNNNLSGEIPSLSLCRSLKLIDFGDNILQGTLPTWVGQNLQNLIVLSLRGNKIHGSIPTSLCSLPFLHVLDLSTNNITGEIPQCLNQISALSDIMFTGEINYYDASEIVYIDDTTSASFIDKVILASKGRNLQYGKNILGLVKLIDLSSNHLTGEIPQSITTFIGLHSLNVSRNNLTGFIPNNIGHMESLESLDLSRNHLYGRIPASFLELYSLGYLDLSFNNLSGKIPEGIQLQTFDSSAYDGNIGLCGPPLINQCPADGIPPSRKIDRNELINFEFYISSGLGFFVGFWGVCGTLIIKSSWRHAYFQFFNNIYDWIFVTVIIFTNKMKRRFQIQE